MHETFKNNIKQETKAVYRYKPAVKDDSGSDLIDKERAMKRWKSSLNYYYQKPEKFEFGLKDL
ncbi:MAG: hypothetical protein ACFFBY_15150 [Promethearchaeota archaeon]